MAEKKIINEDGKQYEFTPGEGGSLIVKGEKKPMLTALQGSKPGTAKVIGPDTDNIKYGNGHGYSMAGVPKEVE